MVDIGSLDPRGERLHAELMSLSSGTSTVQRCCPARVMHAESMMPQTLLLQMCA
jgi:hypothetical protein